MPEADLSREQLIADLGFLTETAMGFLQRDAGSDICQYIVERLACITGDSWVALATFDPERQASCLRALTGPRDLRSRVLGMLGENPVGCYRPISDEARRHLLTGRLHQVPGGLYEVLFGHVPRTVTSAVEKFAGLSEIYAMGCVSQGELVGSVLILLRGSQRRPRVQVVEAFVSQAAVALQRDRAEARLREKEAESRMLIDEVPDLFLVLDRDLTIHDVNRRGGEVLGYARRELLGTPFATLLEAGERALERLRPQRLRVGQPSVVDCQFRRADGSHQPYQVRVTPLPDGRLVVVASAAGDASGQGG